MTKHHLSIDIETRSRLDLADVGVYKYAENCEIILFSYCIDFAADSYKDIKCVDLLHGEKIPDAVVQMLTDKSVVKHAYNAQFERVVLSEYLHEYLEPEQWFDTMLLANYLALPSSLKEISEFLFPNLKDHWKDSRGRKQLAMFSKPKYIEPDLNNPKDLENWKEFKCYNQQDVITEMRVYRALSTFLDDFPDSERRFWYDDQKINDRGVRIDRDLVNAVIRIMDELSYRENQEFQKLTGGLKPTQNKAFAKWLTEETGVLCNSVSKENLAMWYSSVPLVPEKVDRAIKLKKLMSKTSLAKYKKMRDCVCEDGRARGLFKFYGASRTGRYCLTGDHEVLTENGWRPLELWQGGKIAVYNPDIETISFQDAKANAFDYVGDLYEYDNERMKQISTPEHKMVIKRDGLSNYEVVTVRDMAKLSKPAIPLCGDKITRPAHLDIETRILVMTQADGTYKNEAGLMFHFTKERKVERCKMLLRKAGISYTYRTYEGKTKGGLTQHVFAIPYRNMPLYLRMFKDKTYGSWLFDLDAEVFFDELPLWDGYYVTSNSIQYSTCNRINADLVQAFAHLSGRVASIKIKHQEKHGWSTAYVVNIWLHPQTWKKIYKKPNIIHFNGTVYCPTTTTGFFLVRRNGKAWITGNSGALIQLQNLKRNTVEPIEQWRKDAMTGDLEYMEMLTDDVPDVLSQLVRTAIIPRDGYEFIVSDFHAIEAVISAWIAGEKWRLDVFRGDGRIYEASASQMFNVPVNTITKPDGSHGENYYLRAKGKVAELALGYGGGLGALQKMGGEKLGLTEEEMRNIVYLWRVKSPNITAFWEKLDSAFRSIALGTASQVDIYKERNIVVRRENEKFVSLQLPSLRKLYYYEPHLAVVETPYGVDQQSLMYWGKNQTTGHWERIPTRGSKLFENLVQATARDILVHAIHNIRLERMDVVMHIHDECVVEVPKGKYTVDDINLLMTDLPSWATAMPLTAAGFRTDFYMKD